MHCKDSRPGPLSAADSRVRGQVIDYPDGDSRCTRLEIHASPAHIGCICLALEQAGWRIIDTYFAGLSDEGPNFHQVHVLVRGTLTREAFEAAVDLFDQLAGRSYPIHLFGHN